MPAVERLRVAAVQNLHPGAEVCPGRLEQEVQVIRHQAVGQAPPILLTDDVREGCQVEVAIDIVDVKGRLIVPARERVIDAVFDVGSGRTRHTHPSPVSGVAPLRGQTP